MMNEILVSMTLPAVNVSTEVSEALNLSYPHQTTVFTKDITFASCQDILEISLRGDCRNTLQPVRIIVEKVIAGCQGRKCFPNLSFDLPDGKPPFTVKSLTFEKGVVVQPGMTLTSIPSRPGFSRVQFIIQIPYMLILGDSDGRTFTLKGRLPDVNQDIVIYYPSDESRFDPHVRVETMTKILYPPVVSSKNIKLSIGSFIVTKVIELAEHMILSFGECPNPDECEEFQESDPCDVFLNPDLTPFPIDCFSPHLGEGVVLKN